ncbi:MAG: tRNA (adenosine(37)-N6)-threonylcarbamoyltransferase complex dimerization subunit type 1 TsaB [Beijerinckiaceae bacterium]
MIILAIDTSLAAASVCVYDGSKSEVLARETLAMERGQDQALLPMIDRVVAEGAGSAAKIQRVAVTVGPGSFTGIRIGISAARAIGLALDAPVVGVSTLAAFAAPVVLEKSNGVVAAAIDARHGRVYVTALAGGRPVVAPRVCLPKEAVRAMGSGPLWLCGPSAPAIAAEARAIGLAAEVVDDRVEPDITFVARLGQMADAGSAAARPSYMRAPDIRTPASPSLTA